MSTSKSDADSRLSGAQVSHLPEREFLQVVRELARILGWTDYHTWHSLHSPAGFPDLVLVKPPRVIFAELKVGKRQPTAAQRDWLNLLSQCPGVEVYVWYPEDWDEIEEVLKRRTPLGILTDEDGSPVEYEA